MKPTSLCKEPRKKESHVTRSSIRERRARSGASGTRIRDAPGYQGQGVPRLLPTASSLARNRRNNRRGGVGALAASLVRLIPPSELIPLAEQTGLITNYWAVGVKGSLPSGARVTGRAPERLASYAERQRLRLPVSTAQLGQGGSQDPPRDRIGSPRPEAGNHGERHDA